MPLKLDNISILIIEDTGPMRKLVTVILQSLGAKKIFFAENGEQGYAEYKKLNPDIIITDWLMQPVDGAEFVRMVRNRADSPNRTVPIIMMTGFNATTRVMKARDEGVTEFLIKPFTASDLAKRLAYVINRPRDFIQAPEYFGPDRRRRDSERPHDQERRQGSLMEQQGTAFDIDFVNGAEET